MEHRHRPRRLRLPLEKTVEKDRGVEVVESRDPIEELVARQVGVPLSVANPVEAEIRGDSVEKARRVSVGHSFPVSDQSHEDLLGHIFRLTFVPQEKPATAKDHRPIPAVQCIDIEASSAHPSNVTPGILPAVTFSVQAG